MRRDAGAGRRRKGEQGMIDAVEAIAVERTVL
jgi:hypothetical protein